MVIQNTPASPAATSGHMTKSTNRIKAENMQLMESILKRKESQFLFFFFLLVMKQIDVIWEQEKSSKTTAAAAKSLQLCRLCHIIDASPPGSPIPGIFQARVLEWVAISFSTQTTEVIINWEWSLIVKAANNLLPDFYLLPNCWLVSREMYSAFVLMYTLQN